MSKSSSDTPIPVLAITAGDPNGIGPEIIAKALHADIETLPAIPVVIGSVPGLAAAFARWAPEIAVEPGSAPPAHLEHHRVRVIDPTGDPSLMYPEIPEAAFIEHAVRGCLRGDYAAMVTAPISKNALYARGFEFPGHTEFIGHLTKTDHPTMMFVSEALRVSLVTIHVPLKEVPSQVTAGTVGRTLRATVSAMQSLFGFERPRIAVCGLNPHAGEQGHMGLEERTAILPGIAEIDEQDAIITGPIPADTVFSRAAAGEFDVVVAQYHDQGLIPVKLLGFGTAVNLTVGIPIIRTSVDHGVAYDIAGRGLANPSSLQHAIRLAVHLATRSHP